MADVGETVPLTVTFYADQASGTLADPTVVTLSIRNPFGVTTTPTPIRLSAGVWTYAWTPLIGGAHEVRWDGEGAVEYVEPQTIVISAGLDQALATTGDMEAVLGTTGKGNPELVARLAIVTSEHIQRYLDRRFLPVGVDTKTFRVRPYETVISLVPWDFQAAGDVSIVVDPFGSSQTLIVEDDFYIAPENDPDGIADRIMLHVPMLGSRRATRVDVTATFGWPAVPTPVSQAVAYWVKDLIQAVSAFPRGQQVEEAEQLAADGTVPSISRQLLSRYRHVVAA